jgi:hypothetical protein
MMDWFNIYGLAIIAIMMIPNAVYAAKSHDGFENLWENKIVYPLEQVGRFGCFGLMAINIPGTWFGFWFDDALTVYIAVNAVLLLIYCGIWMVCFRDNGVSRALALSVIPSVIFLFSGAMIASIPLIVAAAIFAPCHIVISYKNAALAST